MIGYELEVIFSCCTKQQLQEERYLNSPCLKQDSLDIERKETGKSLKDLGMDICIYFFIVIHNHYKASTTLSLDLCPPASPQLTEP